MADNANGNGQGGGAMNWQVCMSFALRHHLVNRVLQVLFKVPTSRNVCEPELAYLAMYATNIEREAFEAASSMPEYFRSLWLSVFECQKDVTVRRLTWKLKHEGSTFSSDSATVELFGNTIVGCNGGNKSQWKDTSSLARSPQPGPSTAPPSNPIAIPCCDIALKREFIRVLTANPHLRQSFNTFHLQQAAKAHKIICCGCGQPLVSNRLFHHEKGLQNVMTFDQMMLQPFGNVQPQQQA